MQRSEHRWGLKLLILFCGIGAILLLMAWPARQRSSQISPSGDFVFREARPTRDEIAGAAPRGKSTHGLAWSWTMTSWFMSRFEDLMSWDMNPWHRTRRSFGSHYFDLIGSDNPADQEKVRELRVKADELFQQILQRYPELAIEFRDVPDEKNGFLQWLAFSKRMDELSGEGTRGSGKLELPKFYEQFQDKSGSWNLAEAKAWLAENSALMDELRTIGLMPERSSAGIDMGEYAFEPVRLMKSCTEALMMESRVAAEEGRVQDAMSAVQAAKGLADQMGGVETPTLLSETVRILVNRSIQNRVVTEIIPALAPSQIDVSAWQEAVNPTLRAPHDLGELMKSEWYVSTSSYIVPILADIEDPFYPPDPADLIDAHALSALRTRDHFEGNSPTDWVRTSGRGAVAHDFSHLSIQGRDLLETFYIGADAWILGYQRAQSATGMTQAAFAIMKGEPLPLDPIYGQPYRWDPETRQLSAPDTPEFSDLNLDPIAVPQP